MKYQILTILCCVMLIHFSACQDSKTIFPGEVFRFDLQPIAKTGTITHEWVKSPEFGEKVLSFTVGEGNNELILTSNSEGIDWLTAKYFVCEVWHDNPYSTKLSLNFYRKTGDDSAVAVQGNETVSQESGPRISATFGFLPCLKTKMIFPLSYLDGQQTHPVRQPRQMTGFISGRRIDPADIGKVSIGISPSVSPDYLSRVQIASAYLTAEMPDPYEKLAVAMVDSFGQWAVRDWPGKIHSSEELKASMDKNEAIATSAAYPDDWSEYGGWKQLRFTPKGFFYTHHDGNRWWLVDPEGCAFISAGVTCITVSSSNSGGMLTGLEELFSWLPPEDDSLFGQVYQTGRTNMKMIDFLKSNLIRVYGAGWKQKWEETSAGLMRNWRLNTVANWSDLDMARRQKMPYVLNMRGFPTTPVKLYRDFPDVFDPVYRQEAELFAKQLEPTRDDPYLIGYFLVNEPKWAFGDNNVAFEMFATDTPSFAKKEMARWLQKKYGNIRAFNGAWNQNLADFNALETLTMKDRPSDAAWNDCSEFSELMVDQYVETVCREVKKIDSNHLNLGMRYAWISSDLCYRAGAWFDVFSINGYGNPGPPETEEITCRSGKPVMIGEWHFGTVDRGLPSTGLQGAENQMARGEAYRYYFEQGVNRPELIGIHWFQWNDQPVFGRGDGENYNIGFLDICNQPYKELTDQAKTSHERMYRIATGMEKPFSKIIRKVPTIT